MLQEMLQFQNLMVEYVVEISWSVCRYIWVQRQCKTLQHAQEGHKCSARGSQKGVWEPTIHQGPMGPLSTPLWTTLMLCLHFFAAPRPPSLSNSMGVIKWSACCTDMICLSFIGQIWTGKIYMGLDECWAASLWQGICWSISKYFLIWKGFEDRFSCHHLRIPCKHTHLCTGPYFPAPGRFLAHCRMKFRFDQRRLQSRSLRLAFLCGWCWRGITLFLMEPRVI